MQSSHRLIALTIMLCLPLACASRLDRELTKNTPQALAATVDLSQVNFVDISSGETVNVAAYMEANGKDYLLLTFGSRNCASCNKKAVQLENKVIGQDPLFLTEVGQRLEIIGVNTDRLENAGMDRYLADFSFIRWSDPRGMNMLTYFMPEGYTFSVPLTVLVVKEGIAWRIPPDEVVSVDDIMRRTKAYLAGEPIADGGEDDGDDAANDGDDNDDGSDQDDGDSNDDGSVIVEPDPTDLANIAPGRLKEVVVTDCAGEERKLDDILAAQESRAGADMRFVQVARPSCGADCLHNASVLKDLSARCSSQAASVGGKTCSATTLVVGDLTPALCAEGNVYSGGEEFYSVFDTHFYRASVGEFWDPVLPELSGPLTFAFGKSGLLAFSADGRLDQSSADLASWLATSSANEVAIGPAFPLFSGAEGEFSFDTVRTGQELTIMTVFDGDFVCSGCIQELRHWSEPGELVDICEETGRCRMLALEYNQMHGSTPGALRQWLADLHAAPDPFGGPGNLLDGIRVPVVLDPVALDESPEARFHQGFLAALTGNTISKTVVFNREGRIVYVNNPENVGSDEITPAVKQLLDID